MEYPGGPSAGPAECMHRYATRTDGSVACEKCGSVLHRWSGDASGSRPLANEAYGAYAPAPAVDPDRTSFPWKWIAVAGVIALAIAGVLAWNFMHRPGIPVASGQSSQVIDLSMEPVQTEPAKQFLLLSRKDGLTLVTRARYRIAGKVVGVRHYAGFDNAATGFPIDLGLAWGDVGKSDFDRHVRFYFSNDEKHNQWLMYKYDGALPWPESYFQSHVSNNHICPATENLFNAIVALEKGEVVMLEGYLAESRDADGNSMDTSLSRTDTGAGACESFFVQKMQVGNLVYE